MTISESYMMDIEVINEQRNKEEKEKKEKKELKKDRDKNERKRIMNDKEWIRKRKDNKPIEEEKNRRIKILSK
ncbi:hypothetical protein ENUP19_0114G0023 [Entamoeba nuttalli]|uniref:Uncharacterized protein n=1 Tax=Entamoeba nuttalli TaxID=412467 RepID=A0ABQ0DI56_9EUKA